MRLAGVSIALALVGWIGAARADDAACMQAAENGQWLRKAERLREARDQFALCAVDACPKMVREDCVTWLRDLEQQRPSVVVTAHDAAGAELKDVTVVVDGRIEATKLDGRPLWIDPGAHSLRFEHSPLPPVTRELTLKAGERNRAIDVRFARGAEPATPERPSVAESTRSPGPWILTGTGVALAAIGVIGLASDARTGNVVPLAAGATLTVGGAAWLLTERASPSLGPRGAPWWLAAAGGTTLIAGFVTYLAGTNAYPANCDRSTNVCSTGDPALDARFVEDAKNARSFLIGGRNTMIVGGALALVGLTWGIVRLASN